MGLGPKSLTFNYTVQPGDVSGDLDYSSAVALALNDGTIKTGALSATLTLPAPGATGSLGANKAIVIDTAAPATPVLSLTSDTGANGSDKTTSNGTLTVTGLEGGTTTAEYKLGAAGAWTTLAAVTGALTEGSNTVTARQTDLAGNVSGEGSITFTLDRVAPTLSLALTSDTGSSGTDKTTSDAAITTTGAENGTAVQYTVDGGAVITDIAAATAVLTNGLHTITAQQTDLAGNASVQTSITFTLDKTAPATPVLSLASDTGTSGTDKITNDGALTATGLEGDTTTAEYKLGAAGAWTTLAAVTGALTEGSNTVTARQTDLAGNVSGEGSITFILDQTAPSGTVSFNAAKLGLQQTTTVDIVFGENVVQFGLDDLTSVGGSLSNFQKVNESTYQVVYATTLGFFGDGSVSITGPYADIAGNVGSLSKSTIIPVDARNFGGSGDGGAPATPTPTTPTLIPTEPGAYNGNIPALIVADFVNGGTPGSAAKLADLAAFASLQFFAYQAQGVIDPELGPYEALGRGFAETETFQTKYGSLSESAFISTSYKAVFGKDATAAQQQHFQDQIDYFEAIYVSAKISDAQAEILSKGAVLGQMLGVATLEGPSSQPYLLEATNFLIDVVKNPSDYGKPLSSFDMI